jgi:SAM-dependent methyltransferase
MSPHTLFRPLAMFGIALVAACSVVLAHGQAQEYVPDVGQEGKDVVWVPSAQIVVDKMLDMAEVKPGDYLIDLGSGDGRTVIAAARRGAKALGIEYNPKLVALAKRNAARAGVADKATFVEGDIFASDFSEATVLTLFLMPELNLQLLPTILNLKAGTRVVSNTFDMGSWKPDATAEVTRDCRTYCQALLWIVPAKVEGAWQVRFGSESLNWFLKLEQTHQYITGGMVPGTHLVIFVKGRLDGTAITLDGIASAYPGTEKPQRVEFKGEVKGDRMEGSYLVPDKQQSGTWSAVRKKEP